MKKSFLSILAMLACIAVTGARAQNPNLKINLNDYSLGLGSGSYTCFDGSIDAGNQCLAKWLAASVYVINDATTGFDCTTAYPGSWCILYFSSVPYLSNMYWIRDAVGASKYENAILHYTEDTGGLHATSLIGLDQFDWYDQTNGLTEGFGYYVPNEATDGVLLYNGSTFVSDITQWAYGGAVTSVAYSAGVFTVTGIASENFKNITAGQTITLTGFTSATFLNGKSALVTGNGGTPSSPTITFSLTCSANCTGSNETGYLADAQAIPAGDSLYIGSMEPFDQINVRLATSQTGGSVTYQYSKGSGSWGDLTSASHWHDGTAGLASGLSPAQISFYPPTDWAMDTYQGTHAKFWVRITPTGAITQPVIFNVRGDNLLSAYTSIPQCGSVIQAQTGTSCLLRGWSVSAYAASTACAGSPCVVAGSYLYNPNPPASASARFVYQARSGLYGGYGNETWLNPSSLDTDGKTLVGKVLPYLWAATKAAYDVQANGTMFDNAASPNYGYGAAWNAGNQTDLACAPICTDTLTTSNFESYWQTAFTETTANLHAAYSPFFVTGNVAVMHPTSSELTSANFYTTAGTLARISPGLDLSWIEASSFSTSPGYFNSYPQTAENQFTVAAGQDFQVSNAVADHIYAYGFCDIISQTVPCLPIVWNRATRGAMDALASQYIFGNSNTALTYTITSESSYTAGDQYYYFVDSGSTLAGAITSGLHAAPFSFPVTSTTPLTAMTNNMGGSGACSPPGCGTDNLYAGNTIIRICPARTTCENGDIFLVTTSGGTTVNVASNVTQNSVQYVGVVNSYTGTEKVQIAQYGHAALTPTANMPVWQDMDVYASLAPAFLVDIGVPDSVNGWQPPNGNCIYNPNYATLTQPNTPCNRGDPDLFYGSTTLLGSAQMWSGLACTSGKFNSPHGTTNMDCSPLMRRDYTKAIVLERSARTGGTLPTAPEEWNTPSKPIDLSSFQTACAPHCSYYRLRSDGTMDASPISSIQIEGGEAAILMKNPIGSSDLGITTASLPAGTVNIVYDQTLQASGGTSPYSWSITTGSLPAGLSLDASIGAITGTPTSTGTSNFTVKVTDADSATASAMLGLTIQSSSSGGGGSTTKSGSGELDWFSLLLLLALVVYPCWRRKRYSAAI